MPNFTRQQTGVAIQADRDFKIVWDGGVFHGKQGDWLMVTDDGVIQAVHSDELQHIWTIIQDEPIDESTEAKLRDALERGAW